MVDSEIEVEELKAEARVVCSVVEVEEVLSALTEAFSRKRKNITKKRILLNGI